MSNNVLKWVLFGAIMVAALIIGIVTGEWCWYGRC